MEACIGKSMDKKMAPLSPRLRPSRRQAGISLVEVMIATVVLTLSLMGLLFVITYSSRQNQIDKEVQIAQRAAQSVIEAMSSKPFSEIFRMYNDYDNDEIASTIDITPNIGLDAFLAKAEPGSWFDVELRDLDDNESLSAPVGARLPKLQPPGIGQDPTMPGFARPRCGKIIFPGDDWTTRGGVGDPADTEDARYLFENASDSWTASYWKQIMGLGILDMDGTGAEEPDVDMAGPPDSGSGKVRYRMLPVIVEVKWVGLAGLQSVVMHTFIFDRSNEWATTE